MHKRDGRLVLSPTDLTLFMESEFITWMDRYDLECPGAATPDSESGTKLLLQKKGIEHEKQFLDQLVRKNVSIANLDNANDRFTATVAAMFEGHDVIYQAALRDDDFVGFADFLIKVPGASKFGAYHYEPWDTKLALSPKPKFLVQLACYADLLQVVQGVLPASVYVVLGDKSVQPHRTADYYYYYKYLRESLLRQQQKFDRSKPPAFLGLEDFGRWTTHAEAQIQKLDHLCQIANIRTSQIKKLQSSGINTMTELPSSTLQRVPKMEESTFGTLKHQARLQIESRGLDRPKFDLIKPPPDGLGLSLLPPASRLDVYFDMEGNPLADGGLEYLFGATIIEDGKPKFCEWWAHTTEAEKEAFENFIEWCHQRWRKDPRMHVYHYGSYEKTALRRLMGKYGTKEIEVDDFLRNEIFVDIYTIVRQAIRVGEPNYSLKNIERLYRDKRSSDVATAMDSVLAYQNWVDSNDGSDWKTSKTLSEIRAYNIADCDSTWQLAEWLRQLQRTCAVLFTPAAAKDTPSSQASKQRAEASKLARSMLDTIPGIESEKNENLKLRELLAYLLEFHWREAKPVFWAKYDRSKMTEDELFEDPVCLAGLVRDSSLPPAEPNPKSRSWLYEYTFDVSQDTKIDANDSCYFAHDLDEKITVAALDADAGRVLLKRLKTEPAPPKHLSLIKDEFVDAKEIAHSIFRTATAFMRGKRLPSALEDFLCKRPPRVANWKDGSLVEASLDPFVGAVGVLKRLTNSTLCIQGPPGSGKTYLAAKAILELLRIGKKVGITSNSHKAIAHLMDKVAAASVAARITLRAVKVQSDLEDAHVESSNIEKLSAQQFLARGSFSFNLIGGTAWLFSKEEAAGSVDYLFVDEAGQVSIANIVGMAPSARNIVLIGDQMQLSQPLKGTHPGDSSKSALEYLLQGKQVIPDDFGIFLGTTRRMHPKVCSFISGAVYEERLHPHQETSLRVLQVPPEVESSIFKSTGIIYVPVEHEGNSQDSEEESAKIIELVKDLQKCSLEINGQVRPVTLKDVLIVAPYNMQVRRLKAALPAFAIGSVDKFQGQEAPIVIVSMCSSTTDASPRGLEFIFSKNRLNVAISRAQVLALVVGSPALANTRCNRVEQIELVNLFCRIVKEGGAEFG